MRAIPHGAALLAVALLAAAASAEGDAARDEEDLEGRIEALEQQNETMQETLRELREELARQRAATPDAPAAGAAAGDGAATPAAEGLAAGEPAAEAAPADWVPVPIYAEAAAQTSAVASDPLFTRSMGRANLQLLDLSFDALAAVGGSTAGNAELEVLQGGGHDPRQRGFTLQQAEIGLKGAVDPFVTGEAYLVYFLDAQGASQFELEEAFLTTTALPFGLEEHGLQIEAGQFFTEFGRLNPTHPHTWDWMDQPFVLTRLFGGDGARAPGARLGWLLPVPWFAELHLGVQNAAGETMVSFRANDEVFAERAIGGRPFNDAGMRSAADLLYLVRLANGFDLSDATSAQIGASFLYGPNATGGGGATHILGGDFTLKWVPLDADHGWPFVRFQGEVLYRGYRADSFLGCGQLVVGCTVAYLPATTLHDWGFYAQLLVGFLRGWSAGIRGEYGRGHGNDTLFDDTLGIFRPVSVDGDPFRSPRTRISPLLMFQPSEFARLRLQYNYDLVTFLSQREVHSVWLGVEFLFGTHPAHRW